MLTPLVGIEDMRALRLTHTDETEQLQAMRDKSLLISATGIAIESAFKYGLDLPVGAVTASGDWINGRYFASDRRAGYKQMHAEYMAVQDASLDIMAPRPDTIVVTIEPCDSCQDYLSTVGSIQRVGFGLTRQEVAEMGIVKPHEETIFERAQRIGLPYEVVQIDDPFWQEVGRTIIRNVKRDPKTESLEVNDLQLDIDLHALEQG